METSIRKIVEQTATDDLETAVMSLEISGRIVGTTVEAFETECLDQGGAPPIGALVITVDGPPVVYAAVATISTTGIDPSRPLVPHGNPGEDLDTVLARNPHLPLLLRTSFEACVLAHRVGDEIRYGLPESPPRLFARVAICEATDQKLLLNDARFLDALVASASGDDEVLTAFLRRSSRSQTSPEAFLVNSARALVPLLGNEPERLAAILRRIRPL